jgi:hypothetical protein
MPGRTTCTVVSVAEFGIIVVSLENCYDNRRSRLVFRQSTATEFDVDCNDSQIGEELPLLAQ